MQSRSGYEAELYQQLSERCELSPRLRSFLELVFRDARAMSRQLDPMSRHRRIYDLYSGRSSSRFAGPASEPRYLEYWRALARLAAGRWSLAWKARLHADFNAVVFGGARGRSPIPLTLGQQFVFFQPLEPRPGGAARVYLSCWDSSVLPVAETLSALGSDLRWKINSFKVAGPDVVEDRSESIVVYLQSFRAAISLGRHLGWTLAPNMLRDATPALTQRLGPGVAVGAETTMGDLLGFMPEKYAVSFGSHRATVIAAAADNYLGNVHAAKSLRLPPFELFCRFVALAFRGAGLDPLNPERTDHPQMRQPFLPQGPGPGPAGRDDAGAQPFLVRGAARAPRRPGLEEPSAGPTRGGQNLASGSARRPAQPRQPALGTKPHGDELDQGQPRFLRRTRRARLLPRVQPLRGIGPGRSRRGWGPVDV